MKKIWIFVFLTTLLLSLCQPQDKGFEVKDYWLRSAVKGGNTAMYMSIQNDSTVGDELVKVSSDIAEAVEMHKTIIDNNGAMQMSPVSSVLLEPDAEVIFEPGGLHVMFIGLKQDLKAGDKVEVTIHFKNREDMILTVPVQDNGGDVNH